jgi:transglycosylase-like protein with SLT domain
VTALALTCAATLLAGLIAVLTLPEPRSASGQAAGGPAATQPGQQPGQPPGPVATIADGRQVAPLKRVVPPDVLAVGRSRPIAAAKVARIRKIKGVSDVLVVAGGAVRLQGSSVNTLAVDPAVFRSWTPPRTAAKAELWDALAADRFVVSPEAASKLRLTPGNSYQIVAKTIPTVALGGAEPLGLPIDMLVSRRRGIELGLYRDIALLVNAPRADPVRLRSGIARILGAGTDVLNLHETKNQGGGPAGQAGSYLDLYRRAATSCPGLSWTVLAAIGQVESDHGRNAGRSSAGALGPMQFLPSTWKAYGVDGDRDGKADIMNPYDAIPAAAKYLCDHGGGNGGESLYKAVFAYNHADWYVQKVLALARAYADRYR